MSRRRARERVGLDERAPRRRRPACRRSSSIASTTASPVVGLVVEDPVGDAVRLVSHGHMNAARCARRVGAGRRGASHDASIGALERPRAFGLHGVDPRAVPDRAERAAPRSRPAAHGARERAAADLHDDAVERRRRAAAELPAERLAALDREAVQVALAGEGQRAVGDRLRAAGRRSGRPATPGCALADRDAGAERAEPRRARPGRRPRGRTRAASARRRRRRPPRRAPRCRSSRSRGPAGRAGRRARAARRPRAADSTPKRWRALCEPETLPVSSLTQTPPAR